MTCLLRLELIVVSQLLQRMLQRRHARFTMTFYGGFFFDPLLHLVPNLDQKGKIIASQAFTVLSGHISQ